MYTDSICVINMLITVSPRAYVATLYFASVHDAEPGPKQLPLLSLQSPDGGAISTHAKAKRESDRNDSQRPLFHASPLLLCRLSNGLKS